MARCAPIAGDAKTVVAGALAHGGSCDLCRQTGEADDRLCTPCRAIRARALDLVRGHPEICLSLVQRTLKLGYALAVRLLARLEADGDVQAQDSDGWRRTAVPGRLP